MVDACTHLGVPRLVHDAVTMVYRDGDDRWLDEESPVSAPGPLRANLAGEEHLRRFTEGGGPLGRSQRVSSAKFRTATGWASRVPVV